MKILYGVQGTGNGHITRSSLLIPILRDMGHEVEVIISGRNKANFFDIEILKPFEIKKGITFITSKGEVKIFKTALDLRVIEFIKDVRGRDLNNIDLVISDYEPITAWIAKIKNKTSMGIAHQYAFKYNIPIFGDNFFTRLIMNNLAPVEIEIGIHWYHFNQPLLPPIIPSFKNYQNIKNEKGKILVYLPFEDLNEIIKFIKPFKKFNFAVYHDIKEAVRIENIQLKPFSKSNFHFDLISSEKIICNAGFELPSEGLLLGKSLLIKPLKGQMEQISNAMSIQKLALGTIMDSLDANILSDWLLSSNGIKINYSNYAMELAEWISSKKWNHIENLSKKVWKNIDFNFPDGTNTS